MKRNMRWWIISAGVVLIAAAFAFAFANKAHMPAYKQPNPPPASNNTDTSPPATQTPGSYIDYTSEALANAQGRRWLFFYAGWCPQCRALEQDIKKEGVPDGITILKVDYDKESSLKKQYGVTLQTTVVEIDTSGNLVKKFVAYDDPSLDAVIAALGR